MSVANHHCGRRAQCEAPGTSLGSDSSVNAWNMSRPPIRGICLCLRHAACLAFVQATDALDASRTVRGAVCNASALLCSNVLESSFALHCSAAGRATRWRLVLVLFWVSRSAEYCGVQLEFRAFGRELKFGSTVSGTGSVQEANVSSHSPLLTLQNRTRDC